MFLSSCIQVCLYFWKQVDEHFMSQLHIQRACTFVIARSTCHLLLKQLSRHEVDKVWWHYAQNQQLLVSVAK